MMIGAIAAGLIAAGPAGALFAPGPSGQPQPALTLDLRDLGMTTLRPLPPRSDRSDAKKEAREGCSVVPWLALVGSTVVAQALGGHLQSDAMLSPMKPAMPRQDATATSVGARW
jgi:hypothetical protein